MVGAEGIEPSTFGLKGRCSTTELRPCRVVTTSYTNFDCLDIHDIVRTLDAPKRDREP